MGVIFGRNKPIIYGFLVLILLFIFLIVCSNWILTKNCPIDAKILVIEGWLPAGNLEMIPKQIDLGKYEKIFVTGIAHNHPEYLKNTEINLKKIPAKLFSNGCLCISKNAIKKIKSTGTISDIRVFAYGSGAFGKFPNFFVAVDDTVIGNTFVKKDPSNYVFHCNQASSNLQGVYVYFNNDLKLNETDRNLIIDSILINGIVFNKPDDFYIIGDYKLNNNLYTNYPFRSNAVLTTAYLKALGVKNDIITLDTFFNKRNKTLVAAKKLKYFIDINLKNAVSINVVSINGHSRRSYLAYKTVFSDKSQIGIISLHNMGVDSVERKKWLNRVIGEYGKLLITTILYLFS